MGCSSQVCASTQFLAGRNPSRRQAGRQWANRAVHVPCLVCVFVCVGVSWGALGVPAGSSPTATICSSRLRVVSHHAAPALIWVRLCEVLWPAILPLACRCRVQSVGFRGSISGVVLGVQQQWRASCCRQRRGGKGEGRQAEVNEVRTEGVCKLRVQPNMGFTAASSLPTAAC